ncbi:MAG: isocitrate lyase/PEP mutase family protein [Dongiaceae bacterium]
MISTDPFRPLSSVLDPSRCVILPGAYDALSAKLVQETGFEAVYIGSYATAAAGYGLPDTGALTLGELAAYARSIAGAVTLPVIADAEGGFFEPANLWRTVRAFEDAGVAAIHIEDHAGGKHTTLPQKLIPLELMLQRLRAALDARRRSDFAIIARTDAIWATHDAEEAMRRLQAFSAIGIDYLFPNGGQPELLRQFRRQVPGKYVTINLPTVRNRHDWNGAADLVIDYGFCTQAATKALKTALELFRATPDAAQTDALLEDAARFEDRLGYRAFTERSVALSDRQK